MIVAPEIAGVYAQLPERTWQSLQGLGVCAGPVAPEFATWDREDNELAVFAANWQVGSEKCAYGECRLLHVRDAHEELLHTLIYPAFPDRVPLFIALLWQAPDGCNHAFIDLATPGMVPELRDEVSELAMALSIRHMAFLTRAAAIPPWVHALSSGGILARQKDGRTKCGRIVQAYEDYLNAWLDFAAAQPEDPVNNAYAQKELQQMRHQLESRTPGKEVLYRLFGEAWTSRFLGEFLYR